jgi:cysteine desulfurase
MSVSPKELGVDLMSLNGGKIYGPKGIGCLFVRRGIKLAPLIYGGGQEFGLRSGTENVALAVGFSRALAVAQNDYKKERKRLAALSSVLRDGLKKISGISFNSQNKNCSPTILNVSFCDIEGESLLLELDKYGICCSTGSACASTDLKPSYVLLAMGVREEDAHASLRFSIGRFTSVKEIKYLLKVLPQAVARIRSICPKISS